MNEEDMEGDEDELVREVQARLHRKEELTRKRKLQEYIRQEVMRDPSLSIDPSQNPIVRDLVKYDVNQLEVIADNLRAQKYLKLQKGSNIGESMAQGLGTAISFVSGIPGIAKRMIGDQNLVNDLGGVAAEYLGDFGIAPRILIATSTHVAAAIRDGDIQPANTTSLQNSDTRPEPDGQNNARS